MKLAQLFFILILFFVSVIDSRADWINLSGAENSNNIAEIYVFDDHVQVILELFPDDLAQFLPIIPDEFFGDLAEKRDALENRLEDFSKNYFQVIADGEALTAELVLTERRLRVDRASLFSGMRSPYNGMIVPGPPEDKRVLYVELRYPFKKNKPEIIEFVPPIKDGTVTASIGFICYHKTVPVIDFRYLSTKAKLNLNWQDPWYSKFENPNLNRHHRHPLMPFIYVDPYEVRFEVLMRVKDLNQWIDLGIDNIDTISIDKQVELKELISEYFLKEAELVIDQKKPKQAILDQVKFVTVSINGIQIIEGTEPIDLSTAMVGIVLAYQTKEMPSEINAIWKWFPDKVESIPTMTVDPAGPFKGTVTREDNLIVWKNFLKNYKIPTVVDVKVDQFHSGPPLPLITILSTLFFLILAPIVIYKILIGKVAQQLLYVTIVFGLLAAFLPKEFQPKVARPSVMQETLSDAHSVEVLEALLKNIYRSFDFREESDIYDKLASSVDGNLLTEIYLQNRKSFEVKRAGGAQAKVKKVEILETNVEPLASTGIAFLVDAVWTAEGTVGHWGHTHTRKNKYHANIEVKPVDGFWKITGLDLKEELRIDPLT